MADAKGLCDFIAASPSPFHCVEETAQRLRKAGFREFDPGGPPPAFCPGEGWFVDRAGMIVAWRVGTAPPTEAGFRMVGAHTDSPCLRLKPKPEFTSEGYVQWAVEPYGGMLLYTWFDRDLGLSGRVMVAREEGGFDARLLRIDKPIARVPSLAIHLNREVNDKGLCPNKQTHLPPMLALAGDDESGERVLDLIAGELGCDKSSIVGWDLGLHDLQPPVVGGLSDEFVFAPRIDNLACCYTALEALLSLDEAPRATALIAFYDHEEIGSSSERGAASTLMRNLLATIVRDHESPGTGGLERALAASFLVSSDGVHGVHPNYGDKSEKLHKPMMNGGPVIKTNVNLRYSTDAETGARFRMICKAEGVPFQEFVNRSDLACGSTIGPISSTGLAVKSVDVGCAMLSMHSIREQMGAGDVDWLTRVLARTLREA